MVKFVDLIDNGAGPRGFDRTLGMSRNDIGYYKKFLSYYRKYIEARSIMIGQQLSKEEKRKLREELKDEFSKVQ